MTAINSRTHLELSVLDSPERVRTVARAAVEQGCDVVLCELDQAAPLTAVLAEIARACPGHHILIDPDGPVVVLSLIERDPVQFDRATELAERSGSGLSRGWSW